MSPRKLEPWFVLGSFFLLKSAIRPCIEYCCLVWNGPPSFYLKLLDKLRKRICSTVGPSLAASFDRLAHRQNVDGLNLFYSYYFDRCSSELAFFEGDLLVILIDCMILLLPFLDVTRMSMSTVSFLTQLDSGILCLWNAFPWQMIF